MNVNELKAEIARNGLSIPKLAQIIGIDKKTLYSKMKGLSLFTQREISLISKALCLDNAKIISIFFADEVA
jgi:DNA-binding XRE family transcriptional regulator